MAEKSERHVVNIEDLVSRRAAVERRLDDGYLRIEQAVANGEDVAAWESFWINLLSEYESLSDELSAAA